MARKGKARSRRRVVSINANGRSVRPLPSISPLASIFGFAKLRDLEDRRTFHPQGLARPVRSFFTSKTGYRVAPAAGRAAVRPAGRVAPAALGFRNARDVLVCVRRKVRKEVLHAIFGRSGLGRRSRNFRYPRRNGFSLIHC